MDSKLANPSSLSKSTQSNQNQKSYPLHDAINQNDLARVQTLLKDPNLTQDQLNEYDLENRSPLYCAVHQHNIEIVEALLLKEGIDPNQGKLSSKKSGEIIESPLRLAVIRQDTALVVMLLRAGADPESRNAARSSLIDTATPSGHKALIEALRLKSKALKIYPIPKPLSSMKTLFQSLNALKGYEAFSKILTGLKNSAERNTGVDLKVFLNSYDTFGNLLLCCALLHDLKITQKGQNIKGTQAFPCAQDLIACKVDPNKTDRRGRTPLHWIIEKTKNPEAVAFLLNNGAELTRPNENGETAFLIAVKLQYSNIIYTLAQHLKAGDRINTAGPGGMTPRNYAQINPEVQKALDAAEETLRQRNLDYSRDCILPSIEEEPTPEHSLTTYRP